METSTTLNPVPEGGATEIPPPTEPPKPKSERLVDSNQIGLDVVYEPTKAPGSNTVRIDVDVICVHGLGADPDWSWRDKSSGVSWIKHPEMLPAAIPNARILRYGYDAKWWGQDSAIKSRVPDLAVELLHDLKEEPDRREHPQRPLIFICHCFGGLIVEKAICTSRLDEGRFPNIFKASRGLVLLGTPHRGTGDFTSQALVLRIINAEIPVELSIADVLKPKNETLIDLFDDFTNLIADDKIRAHLRVFCFFEQKPTTASDVLSKVQGGEKLDKSVVREFIVDRESAILPGYDKRGLPVNHFQLNKFSKPDDGYYKRVKVVIVDMVKNALVLPDNLQKLVRAPSVRVFRPATAMPPYDKDRYFEGRKEILEHIKRKLAKPERHRVVLLGPPGVGKTHIAVHYAHSYEEKIPTSRVFWITSRTFDEFQRAYIKIGNLLAVPGITDTENDPLNLIKAHLSEETQGGHWLMVLDGADELDSKDLKRMKDYIPSSPLGAVLATTCKRSIAKTLAFKSEDILDVVPFSQTETFPFFRRELTQKRISDDEVCDLHAVLKGLPLAIVQAAAYLTSCQTVTASDYLQKLSTYKPDIAKAGILGTTHISFSHISNTAPFVADLARMAAMFDFQTIPRLLLRYYNDRVDEFCDLMREFSLMDVTTDRGEVSLSQLVRSSIKGLTISHEPLTDTLSEKFPSLDLAKVALPQVHKCGILLLYAQAALRLEANPTTNDDKRSRANLLFKTGKYNAYLKKYEPAIQALKEALQLREEETPPDPKLIEETTTTLNSIKKLFKSPDRLSIQAKDSLPSGIDDYIACASKQMNSKQQSEIETELLKHSNDTSPSAHKASDALGILYDNSLQHTDAITRHEIVHDWCLKTYGPKNLETYRQVYKIGRNLELRGKFAEAEAKYKEAWEGTKECLGENHPEASRILCSLATVYSKIGKRVEARDAFEKALSLQVQDPGPKHADTLLTKHNYAIFLQGENVEAAGDMLGGVLIEQEQNPGLGSGHPDTLRTASNLAGNYEVRGMGEKALELCRLVAPRQVGTLGVEHPDTKATQLLMARIQGFNK